MSVRSTVAVALFVAVSLCLMQFAEAQNQASCTFKYFNPKAGYAGDLLANAINHYNTVVGGTYTANNNAEKGFIRYSGGGLTLFGFPKAQLTVLNKRNYNGTSVGNYATLGASGDLNGSHGLILTSKSFATLDYPGASATNLTGINKSNVMVGTATPSSSGSFGFKYVNGKFTKIAYPGAVQTTITAINDNGVVVGGFEDGSFENPWSGYVLQNGKFKSLSFIPADINNAGTMVSGSSIFFTNGTSKQVKVPGAFETFVNGISDLGLITGSANFGPGAGGSFTWKGYTATCH